MSKAVLLSALTVGGVDYQSGVCNVTVVAEQTSAEVTIAIFDDPIVEVNETFTAGLSVPAAESTLSVSVSATNGTAYVEIQDNGKQSPLHMHVIVCCPMLHAVTFWSGSGSAQYQDQQTGKDGSSKFWLCQCASRRPFLGTPLLTSSTGQAASRCHQATPSNRIGC